MIRLFFLLVSLLIANTAQAATYWVRPTGILGGCLPSATPPATNAGYMSTVTAAIACAKGGNGDIINLRAGTYAGFNTNTNPLPNGTSYSNALTIRAYNNEAVTLTRASGQTSALNITNGSYVIFEGIRLAGASTTDGTLTFGNAVHHFKFVNVEVDGTGSGFSCVGINNTGQNNIWFTGGTWHHCGSYGAYVEGFDNLFENLTIHTTGASPVGTFEAGHTYAIHNFSNSSPKPARNIYRNIRAYNTGGILIWSGPDNVAYNNIVYNGNPDSSGFSVGSGASNTKIYNNTVYGYPHYGIAIGDFGATGTQVTNNIFFNNTLGAVNNTGQSTLLTTNFTTNPRFVDAANGDFRLCIGAGNPHPNCTTASLAIDTGTSLAATFTTDIAGTTRPIGSAWDIGAYEAGITSPVEPTPEYVAKWSLDNVATDASGNGNTLTLQNGATYSAAGKYNQALLLDGVNDYASAADSASLDLTHGFILAAWVNPSSSMTDFRTIMVRNYKYYLYGSSSGYCGNGGVLAGYDLGNGTSVNACYATPLTPNVWTHVAAKYNRTAVEIYINGALVTNAGGSAFMPSTVGTTMVGGSQFGEYFPGRIDEAHIRNVGDLSTAQIASLSTTPISGEVVPVGVLNIGSGTLRLGTGATLRLGQ